MNIEDQVFPKRCGHMAGKEVISAEEMAGKVRACAVGARPAGPGLRHQRPHRRVRGAGLEEAIRRCNLYLEAGADLAFIDGIRTRAEIERAVRELNGPLSVNLMDAITGVKTRAHPHPGARAPGRGPRLDSGGLDHGRAQGAPALLPRPEGVAHRQPRGTDTSGRRASRSTPTSWAFPEYRALEDEYLPVARLAAKYGEEQTPVGASAGERRR